MSATPPPTPLDRSDRRLLALLAVDGRMSIASLAQEAGISRANAYARIERMRQTGVIEGFTVRVHPQRVGFDLAALILVTGNQPTWREMRDQLAALPGVEYCAFTSGEYDALLLVRAPDVAHLRDVILEQLQSLPMVRATHTIFVLEELVRHPVVLPDGS